MAQTVGLDIGIQHVRAVALRGGTVAACASVSRRNDDGTERPLANVLAELGESLPIAHANVVAASELDILARFLHLAPLPPARLNRILRLELSPEEGPAPTMDVVRLAGEGDELCYLGLVVDTAAVRLLQGEMARGGSRPRTISWGPMALAAAASRVPLDGDQLALVVDIGATGTDVALVASGRLLACRRLAIGGDQFTQVLVDSGMSVSEAERAKRASAPILPTAPEPAPAPAPVARAQVLSDVPSEPALPLIDDGDGLSLDLPSEPAMPIPAEPVAELDLELDDEPSMARSPGKTTVAMASLSLGPQLTRAAEMLYGQLATTLAFFKAQLKRSELAPARVLICGGGAGLTALESYLARRFQVPVERWDPFTGMNGAPEREPWLWARAFGLALAGSGADVPRVDLRPEADARRELWKRRLVWPWVAAACILAAGTIGALGLTEQVERDRTEAELLERAVEEHKRLTADLTNLDAERDALREDLRAIAGRIYAARDLLYTVRALKEQTRESKELWVTSLETVGIARDDGDTGTVVTPAPGGRLGSSGRTPIAPRRDSLIDRGAVDIAGRIRFDIKKTDPQMVAFRERYQTALSEWTMPEGTRLFRDVRLTNSRLDRFEKPVGNTDAGEFPFRFRCYFQATSLGSVAAAETAAVSPEAKPEPEAAVEAPAATAPAAAASAPPEAPAVPEAKP
jgi:Tfp pilus assembly PilM family ATPase